MLTTIIYDSPTDLRSSTENPRGEGAIWRTQNGYTYTEMAAGTTSAPLTTAGGVSLTPLYDGAFPLGALAPDATGSQDASSHLQAAISAALSNSDRATVLMPKGTFLVASNVSVTLSRGQRIALISHQQTELRLDGGDLNIGTEAHLSTTLAAPIDAGAISADLASVEGLEVGDLLRVISDESIETGWNYDKNDLRRVVRIDGTTVYVHKPFRWPHSPSDGGHSVLAFPPAKAVIEGLDFYTGDQQKVTLRYLSRGHISGGRMEGPSYQWSGGVWSDGLSLVGCMGVDVSMDFKNMRYSPNFIASHACRLHDCELQGVRHADFNTWSEDCMIERVRGIATQGLIQSHPNTGGIFRDIIDSVEDEILQGFDPRGLGEIIENCKVMSTAPNGSNTQAPLLKTEYDEIAKTYTRTIRRLDAPHVKIRGSKDGLLVVRESNVSTVDTRWYGASYQVLDMDHTTRSRVYGTLEDVPNLTRQVTLDTGYDSDGSPVTIDSITQAAPARVATTVAHGFSDGDRVWLYADEMGLENYYLVSNADSLSFDLTDVDGVDVDTSEASAYTTGGRVTKVRPLDRMVAPPSPFTPDRHYWADLGRDLEASTTRDVEWILDPFGLGNNVDQHERMARIKVRAFRRQYAERSVILVWDAQQSYLDVLDAGDFTSDGAKLSVSGITGVRYFREQRIAEGMSNWSSLSGRGHYIVLTATIETPDNKGLDRVTCEVEEWMAR